MVRYIRLMNEDDLNRVMRLDGRNEQYIWDPKKEDWVKTGYFAKFTMQEDLSDMYEEITLAEANKIISGQK